MQRYCGRVCAADGRRGRPATGKIDHPPKACEACGVLFHKPATCPVSYWEHRKYCSQDCSAVAQAGRPAHNKGVPGKPWDDDRRRRASERTAAQAEVVRTSKWSGGTWQRFRRLALKRDDYTCQACGFRDPEIMTVDHIVPRALAPERMYDMTNIVTACPNCHARKTIEDRRLIRSR